jgi:choice-of-anchor A domain-containing protein
VFKTATKALLALLSISIGPAVASAGLLSTPYDYGQLQLTGTSASLNVCHVSGSQLASATGFTIHAPAGSTVVINVDGTSDRMANFGFTLQGIDLADMGWEQALDPLGRNHRVRTLSSNRIGGQDLT